MRTETVCVDGLTFIVRGRNPRTTALKSEYLLSLKQAHPDMRRVAPNSSAASSGELTAQDPRGWSLITVASTFRLLAARVTSVQLPDGETFTEPYAPDTLVKLFDIYLDSEQLPDKSDAWTQLEMAIRRMDDLKASADPQAEGNMRKT